MNKSKICVTIQKAVRPSPVFSGIQHSEYQFIRLFSDWLPNLVLLFNFLAASIFSFSGNHGYPQSTDPPPLPVSAAKAGGNYLNE